MNSKVYIGQTSVSLKNRFIQHCCKTSNCAALRNAISKYGKEKFYIESIYESDSLEELNKKEQELIIGLNCIAPNGYNLRTGGDRFVMSEETKIKMSKSKIGIPKSKETRKRMSEAWKGVPKGPKTLEQKERQRVIMSGKTHSQDSKNKMSDAKKRKIICNETGTIYPSIMETAKALGCHKDNLSRHLSGKYKKCKGLTFRLYEEI